MKKLISKLAVLLLVLVVGLTVTACKKDKNLNTNVPFGTLTDATYASVGDYKITEKELYNLMRSSGYQYLVDMIINELIPTTGLDITNEETKQELVDLINLDCFGTSEKENIDTLSATQKETSIKKYQDAMYLSGVNVYDDIYSETNLKHYLPQLAQKEYAKKTLTDSNSKYYYKNETYVNDEGKTIDNPYHISDEEIESQYLSTRATEDYYEVVIVGYHTLAEADAALEGHSFADEASKNTAFDAMYKEAHGFKTGNYKLTDKDLSVYNSSLVTLVSNMKAGEVKLSQQFGKMVYHVYLKAEKPEAKFENATEDDKTQAVEDLLDSFVTSSFVASAVNELLENTEITIYDPAFDALFANDNSKHEVLLAENWDSSYNNLVAKFGDKTISVAQLYEKLEKVLGYSTAMDYISTKILLASPDALKLTSSDLDKIEKDFETVIEQFENNEFASQGYPSNIGKDVFKLLYFGQSSDEDVLNYYKSQKVWEYRIANRDENYYNSLVTFGQKYIEKYYDLSVKHVLLFVDYDADGTPDDPEVFVKKLTEGLNETEAANVKAQFEKTIRDLMNLYADEVHTIVENDWASLKDALDIVKKRFYANDTLFTKKDSKGNPLHWDEFKAYGIGVTVEDLGSVNVTNASNYVPEFGIGVKAMHDDLVKREIILNGKLQENYLPGQNTVDAEGKEVAVDLKDFELIKTSYGYHMLGAYNYTKIKEAKYTSSDDKDQYKDITITLNGEEITVDAYSEENYASLNQIKIYAAQIGTKDGVTDLPTNVETFIGYFYNTVETRYKNTTFQNILFAVNELDMTFANAEKQADYNTYFAKYIEIQKNQFESYTDYSDTYLGTWWDVYFPAQ